MKKLIKYLVLSDLHLGHRTNNTENIVNNLREYIHSNHKLFKTLQIIFIAGDIFDTLLSNNSKEYLLSIEWLTELLLYCKHNNIKLRILEGTPSHDWKQSKTMNTIISKLNIDVDYKYIDTLHIEKMQDLGINVLYVPDEYKHKATETEDDINKLLIENELTQVDITIMHGCFHYQLPMIRLESNHNESYYLSITKYYISVGHIHSFSVYDRILAQGSFDRLAHNEEEDKGGTVITISSTPSFMFIKNELAKVYKTLHYEKYDMTTILSKLKKDINKLPVESNIRIIVNASIHISKNIKVIKDLFKSYVIKITTDTKEKKQVIHRLLENTNMLESIEITPKNLEELLTTEINKHDLSLEQMVIMQSELKLASG